MQEKKGKIFDKDSLYQRTHWFSRDCQDMINKLDEFGLCIVDKKDIDNIDNETNQE